MTLIARRETLALAAVLDIALHARPEPVAAKALALRLDLPPRHLEPLLQVLVRGGILRGLRGPRGGYELARERRRISVADVLRASLAEAEGESPAGPDLVTRVVLPALAEVAEAVLRAYEGVTIDELCERALASEPGSAQAIAADFTI